MNGTTTTKTTNVGDFGPHVPEDKIQYLVQTPYGTGLTIRTRRATKEAPQMQQIELVTWKNAQHAANAAKKSPGIVKPAYLYSTTEYPSVAPQVGDDVMCTYGRGRIIEIRGDDKMEEEQKTIVILLSSWRLANRSRVTCYMHPKDVRVVRTKKVYEMTVHERVEEALALKNQAAKDFASKDYRAALQSYAKAIDAVRYVQHKSDSDNYVRADLLVIMVTCTNNAGTCARQLGHWEETYKFAKNAEVLLDAMEKKKGLKIHTILVKDGYHDVKTFGEWKVKSLMLQARSLAEKKEFDQTIETLKKAHDIINKYTTGAHDTKEVASIKALRSLEREVKKLHAACKERKAIVLKKEKQRAAAMFGGPSKENKSNQTNSADTDVSPTDPVQEDNPVKDKENQIPNSTTEKSPSLESSSIFEKPGETLPLNDSSEFAHNERSVEAPKRQVSFSNKVTSYEIPKDEGNLNDEENEIAWYKDPEALLGAAIFGGAVIVSSFLVSSLMRRKN